jgi:DNA polymerase-3 subunit delta'
MRLIGHRSAVDNFIGQWRSGRMPHAWLIAGPQGIGKRRFADAAAAYVLADAAGPRVTGDDFAGPAAHPTSALIAAGSHMDLRVVERLRRERTGDLATGIAIDQVRELAPLLHNKAGLSPWRVVVIDAVDDLARAAANALLKNLEEPPSNTLFLLISHQPGRLLPTIRSRTRLLRLRPLDDAETGMVLDRALPDADDDERAALVGLAEGAPGRALRFAGLDIQGLETAMSRLISRGGESRSDQVALAKALSGKAAQARYEAFLELAPARIVRQARSARGASLARALALWEKARDLAASAVPLSLDPQGVVFELGGMLAALQTQGENVGNG